MLMKATGRVSLHMSTNGRLRLCLLLPCLLTLIAAQDASSISSTSLTTSSSSAIQSGDRTSTSSSYASSSLLLSSSASFIPTTLISITSSANSNSPITTSSTIDAQSATSTSTTETEISSPGKISEETLAIILGACIGSIALLFMLVVFCCAFRYKRTAIAAYDRTPSPLGSESASKVMQAITSRKIFSSRSANAPEVLHRSDSLTTKGNRRAPPTLQILHQDSSEIGLALGMIDESPQLTPTSKSQPSLIPSRSSYRTSGDGPRSRPSLASQHSSADGRPQRSDNGEGRQSRPSLASQRSSGEARPPKASMSKYHTRSIDVLDAAARRSVENAPLVKPTARRTHHTSSTHDLRSPSSPPFSPFSAVSSRNSQQSLKYNANSGYFKRSQDSLRSDERLIGPPRVPPIPSRSPHRRSSPVVARPNQSVFDLNDFDESDGQQGARERPSMALARRSGSWKPDQARGRHELA